MIHIVEYDEIANQIEQVKDMANFLPDVTNEEGYNKSKRVALDIGKLLTALENKRKERKAYFLEGGREVDSQAKRIAETLETFQLPHKEAYKLLDEQKKQREEKRKQDLEERVSFMRNLPAMLADSSSDEIMRALNDLQANECLDFYEYTSEALKARNASKVALSDLYIKRDKEERDAIELARLQKEEALRKQAEHDESIRKEAAEKATIEAEKKAKVEREENERKLAEQQEAAKKKEADDLARREANTKHLAKINSQAVTDLVNNTTISEEAAKAVIVAIAKGLVSNVKINY